MLSPDWIYLLWSNSKKVCLNETKYLPVYKAGWEEQTKNCPEDCPNILESRDIVWNNPNVR